MAAEAVPAGAEEQPAVVELSGDVGTKYRAAADVVQKVRPPGSRLRGLLQCSCVSTEF